MLLSIVLSIDYSNSYNISLWIRRYSPPLGCQLNISSHNHIMNEDIKYYRDNYYMSEHYRLSVSNLLYTLELIETYKRLKKKDETWWKQDYKNAKKCESHKWTRRITKNKHIEQKNI
jgi:hypothetical protein